MGLRDRLDQRKREREVFGANGTAATYVLPKQLIAGGADFWVKNDAGQRVFRFGAGAQESVDGVVIEDAHGAMQCRIGSDGLVLRDSLQIDGPDGEYRAIVHRTFLSEVREQWYVSLPGVQKWEIHGSVGRLEYELRLDGRTIAQVSKKGARDREHYAVEVAPGEDTALLLAVAVAADAIEHGEK